MRSSDSTRNGHAPAHGADSSTTGLAISRAARSSCEARPDNAWMPLCLALVYQKLRRQADAEALLAKHRAAHGDLGVYQYAEIYAQWGDSGKAREWLATAVRVHDPA